MTPAEWIDLARERVDRARSQLSRIGEDLPPTESLRIAEDELRTAAGHIEDALRKLAQEE